MANLKNVNLMSQDIFESITPSDDELYAVSASGIGFPSNKSEDLIVGVSGTTYIAPANGYFRANVNTGDSVMLYGALLNGFNASSIAGGCDIKVRKGTKVALYYTGTVTHFRFVYAEGE